MSTITEPIVQEALTIAEARRGRTLVLNLSSTSLESLPAELATLTSLTRLNLSDNNIRQIPDASCFPPHISEINLTGCQLTSVPDSLCHLPELKKLQLGVNSLSNINAIFSCSSLQHASLAYNSISSLPDKLPSNCGIVSLDLSHNNITDLSVILMQLQMLPSLRNLSLEGNPVCLLPQYGHAVRSSLKNLKFFDGTKLDATGRSPPSTAQQLSPAQEDREPHTDTYLQLELSGLQPTTDPFQDARALLEQPPAPEAAQAVGGTAAQPAGPTPSQLPLQPVFYHVELTDKDGISYSSVPLRIQPPQPPVVEQNAKNAKAAKPKAPVGKADKKEAAPPPTLKRGYLRLCLSVTATTDWRDWIRGGIALKLVCTTLTSVAKPVPEGAPEAPPPTPPPKGKGAKGPSKGEPEPPLPPEFDVVSTQEVAGAATVRCAALVNGHTHAYKCTSKFIPVPSLWDKEGIRMGLEDDRHSTVPVASVNVKLTLHASPMNNAEEPASR